jgi:hypothetical protein
MATRICANFINAMAKFFFYVSLIMAPLFASQLLDKVSDREKMRHFVKKAGI